MFGFKNFADKLKFYLCGVAADSFLCSGAVDKYRADNPCDDRYDFRIANELANGYYLAAAREVRRRGIDKIAELKAAPFVLGLWSAKELDEYYSRLDGVERAKAIGAACGMARELVARGYRFFPARSSDAYRI